LIFKSKLLTSTDGNVYVSERAINRVIVATIDP
jgi:hypothetical protein